MVDQRAGTAWWKWTLRITTHLLFMTFFAMSSPFHDILYLFLVAYIFHTSFPWYNFSANLSDSWLTQLSEGSDAGLMLYYYLSVSYLIPFASGEITRGDFKRGGMRYWHLVTVSNCNLDWLLPLFQKYSACSASASSPAFFCLPRTTDDLSLSWVPSSLTKKWSNIFQE